MHIQVLYHQQTTITYDQQTATLGTYQYQQTAVFGVYHPQIDATGGINPKSTASQISVFGCWTLRRRILSMSFFFMKFDHMNAYDSWWNHHIYVFLIFFSESTYCHIVSLSDVLLGSMFHRKVGMTPSTSSASLAQTAPWQFWSAPFGLQSLQVSGCVNG